MGVEREGRNNPEGMFEIFFLIIIFYLIYIFFLSEKQFLYTSFIFIFKIET